MQLPANSRIAALALSAWVLCRAADMCAAQATSIEDLVSTNEMHSTIRAFIRERSYSNAVAELIDAIETDARFAQGTKAREAAIRALTLVRAQDGRPGILDAEQVSVLLEAAADSNESVQTRVVATRAIAFIPEQFHESVDQAILGLLSDEDPHVLAAVLTAASFRGGLDKKSLARVRAIVVEPDQASPEAFRAADEFDQRLGVAINTSALTSTRTLLRATAAGAFGVCASHEATLELVRSPGPGDASVYAFALVRPVLERDNPLSDATDETKRRWVASMERLLVREDGAYVAECCAMMVLVKAATDMPELSERCADAARAIAAAHDEIPELTRSAERLFGARE